MWESVGKDLPFEDFVNSSETIFCNSILRKFVSMITNDTNATRFDSWSLSMHSEHVLRHVRWEGLEVVHSADQMRLAVSSHVCCLNLIFSVRFCWCSIPSHVYVSRLACQGAHKTCAPSVFVRVILKWSQISNQSCTTTLHGPFPIISWATPTLHDKSTQLHRQYDVSVHTAHTNCESRQSLQYMIDVTWFCREWLHMLLITIKVTAQASSVLLICAEVIQCLSKYLEVLLGHKHGSECSHDPFVLFMYVGVVRCYKRSTIMLWLWKHWEWRWKCIRLLSTCAAPD